MANLGSAITFIPLRLLREMRLLGPVVMDMKVLRDTFTTMGFAVRLPFHYVWSAHAQNSFYTMDAQERDDVINSRADGYTSEGVRGFLVRF